MKKQWLHLFIGCLISAFFLWLAFRKVDFQTLWVTLRSINYWWTIPFVVVTLLSMYVRSIRWHYLLLPSYKIPTRRLFSPLMIGFAFNGIFPARAGEFARAYVLGKKEKMTFSAAFATVIVERIFDGLTMLFLFAITLMFLPEFGSNINIQPWDARHQISSSTLRLWLTVALGLLFFIVTAGMGCFVPPVRKRLQSALASQNPESRKGPKGRLLRILESCGRAQRPMIPAAILGALSLISLALVIALWSGVLVSSEKIYTIGKVYAIDGQTLQALSQKFAIVMFIAFVLLVLLLINPIRQLIQAGIRRLPLVSARVKEKTVEIFNSFTTGLTSLRNIRALIFIVIYSLVVWGTVGYSLVIMSYGFEGLSMTFPQAMAITIIICVAILIPAAPGYWGLYEFGCVFALRVLNIEDNQSTAIGFSLVIHTLQMAPIILIGLFFAWRQQVSYRQISKVGSPS